MATASPTLALDRYLAREVTSSPSGVIEVVGLRKEYRRLRPGRRRRSLALAGLDLFVPAGGVFGLLGPNGSGKTTTIRCLLGLVAPTAGTARLLGADPARALHTVIRRVGSMVETPSFFPTMSGRRNLELVAGTLRIGRSAVDAALDRAGLAERGDDLVRSYSLGMRQRLGLAAALLRDPEVLILDEPANGLDPAGIKETRELLRRLGGEGRTVVLSSHLLAEVQHVCDRVAILDRGRCIAAGSVAEVLNLGHASGLLVRIEQPAAAQAALAAVGLSARVCGDGRLLVDLAPDAGADVTRALAGAGLYPSEVRPQDADLETVFLELTATAAKESA